MDFIIWLIVLFFIFGRGDKKKKQQTKPVQTKQAEQQREVKKTVIFGDLGDFVREFQELMTESDAEKQQTQPEPAVQPQEEPRRVYAEMTADEIRQRKQQLNERKRRRKQQLPAAPAAEECDFCTGEAEVASVFVEKSAPVSPIFISENPNRRDLATAFQELNLNPLQQAVVWREVLDKPLALRRRP